MAQDEVHWDVPAKDRLQGRWGTTQCMLPTAERDGCAPTRGSHLQPNTQAWGGRDQTCFSILPGLASPCGVRSPSRGTRKGRREPEMPCFLQPGSAATSACRGHRPKTTKTPPGWDEAGQTGGTAADPRSDPRSTPKGAPECQSPPGRHPWGVGR